MMIEESGNRYHLRNIGDAHRGDRVRNRRRRISDQRHLLCFGL